MASVVTILVNGETFQGWKSVSLDKSIENLSGSFSIAFSDRWSGQSKPWPIREQDNIEIQVNKKPISVGFVDSVSGPYSASSHELGISGREKTADLIDNSAIVDTMSWKSTTFRNVVRALTAPYGISFDIINANPSDKFAFAVQSGESVFENLTRLAAKYGLLMRTAVDGSLLFESPAWRRPETGIAIGYNIKSASFSYDAANRFSKYIVRGQDSGDGSSGWGKKKPAQASGQATDPGVKRNRVLLIQAETNATNKSAKRRAEWERDIRRAKALKVEVNVQDWFQTDSNQLWEPGIKINTYIPEFELNDMELLIDSVSYTQDETGGTNARLSLVHPDSYLPEPPKRKTTAGGGDRWK